MTYFDDHARTDAAVRLHRLLSDVRAAPTDARNYMLFDRRDELNGLGVDDDQINGFDAANDAALDHHIARAGAMAREFGHNNDQAAPYWVAQLGPTALPPRGPGQRFIDAYHTARRSTFSGASGIAATPLGSADHERDAVRQRQQAAQTRRDALDRADPSQNANGGILGQGLADTATFTGSLLGRLSSAEGMMDPSGSLLDVLKQNVIDRALAYGEQPGGGAARRQRDFGLAEHWGLRGPLK